MTHMETPLPSEDGSTPARPAPSPRVSRWVLALALAALLALGAGDAWTAAVCSNTPGTGDWVYCEESDGSTDDIDISLSGVMIEVPETSNDAAVTGHQNQALGHVDIDVEGSNLTATADGGAGVLGRIFVGNGDNDEDVDIDVRNTDITTSGTSKTLISGTTFFAHGIHGYHDGSGDLDINTKFSIINTMGDHASGVYGLLVGSGNLGITVDNTEITTMGVHARAVYGQLSPYGSDGDVDIDVRDTMIETTGDSSYGVGGLHRGTGDGDIDIDVQRTTIETEGASAYGIYGNGEDGDTAGMLGDDATREVHINSGNTTIVTEGASAHGIWGRYETNGGLTIEAQGGSITTEGNTSYGVYGYHLNGEGDIFIDLQDIGITTEGTFAHGIFGWQQLGEGNILIKLQDVDINTNSMDLHPNRTVTFSTGIYASHQGTGHINIDVDGGSVTTNGSLSRGILGSFRSGGDGGDVRISVTDAIVTTKGMLSDGIYGIHTTTGNIDIDVTDAIVRTESTDRDPDYGDTFSMGIYANHTVTGNVKVSVTGGSVETLGVNSHGILVWHRSTTDPERTIDVTVEGTSVTARGAGANAIQVGAARSGIAERAAAPGADGYRKQTVRVNGPVYGGSGQNTAGVYLGGGGKVYIGPKGSVGAESGIAVLATGSAPRLYLDMDLDGRRLAEVIGDDWIINDGGRTTIVVNDVTLHDERGVTGLEAPNGAFDVTMRREGVKVTDRATDPWSVSPRAEWTGRDRDFSAGDFVLPTPVARRVELVPAHGSGGEWNAGERVEVRVRFSMRVRVEVPGRRAGTGVRVDLLPRGGREGRLQDREDVPGVCRVHARRGHGHAHLRVHGGGFPGRRQERAVAPFRPAETRRANRVRGRR